ncbi:single-stranded-DNA-specific exonuclease RecJ [Pedobacter yulinensis]|uniref:Single-stranded-DNA-specific exonuclease RecJ n=1 Tax=Pedobacter yulinensis TaxID=2126353 RepID=A0A2T3HQC0_9SPHI|nr:single-stranded-DNA-specific exonuclease RecJ [Pedobacter yulinensis]PST84642.1 single-stranded-DNA-specific exonuclease RecJ [Pedobacter yulinensis]
MEKRWVPVPECSEDQVGKLALELGIDQTLSRILVQRGICSFDAARDFFRPQISHLHDPFLMKDMDIAVARIRRAIASGERIMVFGDYDVDGTTAVTVVYSFLAGLAEHLEYYIPDRYAEGYGVSYKGIDCAEAHGASLIIALDCGIKSVAEVAYARQKGIDFIVCDHHLPGPALPDAVAILDPKRNDCSYPFEELCGCGIGFKLTQALCKSLGLDETLPLRYLDLVMVAIAADIVPVVGENRVLAYHGLKKLNENPSRGLYALMEVAGKTGGYTLTDVVFSIGPRINAAGRMDHASHAVEMLLSAENVAAQAQSLLINDKNAARKMFDQDITREALAQIEADELMLKQKTTVVYSESWHKGVIGIVASRLTEKYYRPTIVLTAANGHVAGSARSVAGFDLYEALQGCAHLLDQFGGHRFAAGLTMRRENVEAFRQKFEEVVAASINEDLLTPVIPIDATLGLAQITGKFARILAQMGPFGPHNMAPVFVSVNVMAAFEPAVVGGNHLRLAVKQENSAIFEAIAFGQADMLPALRTGMPFSICYTIEENTWRDKKRLQLNIKAIRPQNG